MLSIPPISTKRLTLAVFQLYCGINKTNNPFSS